MDITLQQIFQYGSFWGASIAMIALIWTVVNRIIDRVEKGKNRTIEYQHEKSKQLELEKIELQKQLQKQQQHHFYKLIETIRDETRNIAEKVDSLTESFARTDEKLKANVDIAAMNLKKINCFIDATNKRFETIELETKFFRSELHGFGKNLCILKDAANKVR